MAKRKSASVSLFTLGLLGALLAVVPLALDRAFRKAYPVHTRGAVIVTGASTGIGNHAVKYLATRYPEVVIYAGVRKEADADAIEKEGLANLKPLMIDMMDEESMDAAVLRVRSELAEAEEPLPLIGLVNNAGVSNNAPLEFLPMAKLRQLLETNVVGPTYLTQQLTRDLREMQGRVVQISSVLGVVTMATRGAYSCSKHALEALSDVLRVEMAPFNVSVSVVEPAYVKTEIFGKIIKETEELIEGEAMEIYGPLFYRPDQAERRRRQVGKADSPIVTSEAIEHALFSRYPRTRYVVANFDGMPAWIWLKLAWLVPDRVADYIKTLQ